MGKAIKHIVSKELTRFFKDRRLLVVTVFLPAIFIFAMYSLMGIVTEDRYTVAEDQVFICQVQNAPESFAATFGMLNFDVTEVTDTDSAMEQVKDKTCDLLVIFPQDFDQQIADGSAVPNIHVHYNTASTASQTAYDLFTSAAQAYEESFVNLFDVNKDVLNADLASDNDLMIMLVSGVLPMLVIMQLFSGCIGVAPESIAGEKERGTIATLLVTPVSRAAIALGKVISLSIIATLSGIVSFISIMLTLPSLMGPLSDRVGFSTYGFAEYAGLFFVIISSVLLIVALVCVISALAKSIKEASSTATPLALVASISGFLTMMSVDFSFVGFRLIPIFNSALCLNDIFTLSWSVSDIAITCLSNVLYMVILVVVLTKMFNSEKVMFKA